MKKIFALFVLSFVWCGQAGAEDKQLTTQEIQALQDRDILLMGDGLLRTLNYERVISFADQILQVKPHNPEAYYWKGMALREMRKYKESIEFFTLSIKYGRDPFKGDPNVLGEIYYDRGQSFELSGHLEEALSDFEKAIELGFDLRDAYFCRNALRVKLGYYKNQREN